MYKAKKEVLMFRCSRCKYEWIPRNPEKEPRVCPNPKCHSPYWKEPRKKEQKRMI